MKHRSYAAALGLLTAGLLAGAFAATQVYHVEPRTSSNGWSPSGPTGYVGQTFVANVDSIECAAMTNV